MRRKGGRVWLKVCFSIFLCLAIAEVGGRVAWLLRPGEFFSAGEAWKGQNALRRKQGPLWRVILPPWPPTLIWRMCTNLDQASTGRAFTAGIFRNRGIRKSSKFW